MTCKQARQLLAASRRGDCSPGDYAELQAHLAGCEGCRTRDVEYQQVGEAIGSLPEIAPPPDFLARVLAAARAEESQAAQPTAAKKAPETVVVTGPTDASYFPTLRKVVAERRVRVVPLRGQVSPAATFALRYGAAMAAAFMLFSLGSLMLVQLLYNHPGTPPISCVGCQSLHTSYYAADSTYPFVSDAIASEDGHTIVYAARTADGQYMLEALTEPSRQSVDLLPAPVSEPITLEGWARGWVLWSEGDTALGAHWTLNATQMLPALAGATTTLQIAEGGQADAAGPAALHGVHESGSLVLVAEEMADRHGRLLEFDLAQVSAVKPVVLASAQPEHLIADPATDGSSVYWADEWRDLDGTLHGDIYRRIPDSQPVQVTHTGFSFSPMLVSNMLIWLGAPAAQADAKSDGQSTPTITPTSTGTLTPVGGSASTAPVMGTLWEEALDGRPDLDSGPKKQITQTAADPEAGATFVAWQDGNGNYSLYDVTTDHVQPLNTYISDPLVFSVSPKAVLWVTADKSADTQTPAKTTINVLAWPQK
ncbi:MAG TPA: zf-HC2 domain-containing protein [Ktedonobacterales bacterium]|jgi:hypothetical protein